MKKLYFIFLTTSLFLIPGWSLSQDFKMDIIDFMEKYEMYSSFTKDGLNFEQDYIVSFTKLFKNRNDKSVYNDLDSSTLFVKPSDYASDAQRYFKRGINVSIEILELIPAKNTEMQKQEITVSVKKTLFGLKEVRGGKAKIRNYEYDLVFILEYSPRAEGNKISIVKIYNPNDYHYFPGLHIGLCIQPALTNLVSKEWQNTGNAVSGWDQKSGLVFNFGLEAKIYTKDPKINYGIRLIYSSYKTNLELQNYSQQDNLMVDRDNDPFYLRVNGNNIEEEVNTHFIEVPIFYSYVHEVINSRLINHVYANIGPSFGFQISKAYDNSGVSTHEGYYPAYHVELYDIPEYGYYTNRSFSSSSETSLKKFNISGYFELGLNLNIFKMMSLEAGFFGNIGLLNLASQNANYLFSESFDNYTSILDSRAKVETRSLGLNIGLKYKIK